jgi:hypothetical protein
VASRATAYTGETGKIYRPNRAYSQGMLYMLIPLLPIFLIIPLVIILSGLRRGGAFSGIALVALIAIPTAGWLVWRRVKSQADKIFLVLSSSGIAYYGSGIVIKTTWANTKEITSGTAMPSLLLHQPAATYIGLAGSRDLSADRRIPLYIFYYSKHSELARDLRRYAPHLFPTPKT